MKVLQVNANYGFGSTGLIVKDIGEMLTNTGNEALFAYQRTKIPLQNGYQIGNIFDWKLHAVLCRVFGAQCFYSSFYTRKFIRELDKIKPDVVHLHNLHSNFINIDLLLSYLAKNDIATVITMHDCWYFTGKCFHYIDCGCIKFTSGCGNCPKRKMPPQSLLFDRSKGLLERKKKKLLSIPRLTLVGCSQWICKEAQKGILKNCNIQCIYNGVDTEIFCPSKSDFREKYQCESDFLVMGMANKWLLGSNIEIINRIICIPGIKLIIVGCTENQMKYLSQFKDRVIALGFIRERHELASIYSVADVFVNLTHADTLPTVNMESICCGTPVITYDSCGSPELVDDESGFVVKENDQNSIIDRIIESREKKFPRCREVGITRFEKNECYKEYIEIYDWFKRRRE
ncbi:MAG: glycosyltransferase [Hespellia sp.]|nr:glycosyltransferase [Hespellia sp.]